MIKYIFSEKYALKMVEKDLFENNLATNYASIPNYYSESVETVLINRYSKYKNLNISISNLFYSKNIYPKKINYTTNFNAQKYIEKIFKDNIEELIFEK